MRRDKTEELGINLKFNTLCGHLFVCAFSSEDLLLTYTVR